MERQLLGKFILNSCFLMIISTTLINSAYADLKTKTYQQSGQLGSNVESVSMKIINCTGREMNIDDFYIPDAGRMGKKMSGYDVGEITYQYLSRYLKEAGAVETSKNSSYSIDYSYPDPLDKDKKSNGILAFGYHCNDDDPYHSVCFDGLFFKWYENIDKVDLQLSGTSATVKLLPGKNEETPTVFISNASCADTRESGCTQKNFSSVPDQLGAYPSVKINPQLEGKDNYDHIPSECGDIKKRQFEDLGVTQKLDNTTVATPGDVVQFKFPFAPGDRSAVVCKYIWRIKNAGEKIDCQDTKGNTRDDIAMQFTQDGTRIRVMCVGKNCPKLKNT